MVLQGHGRVSPDSMTEGTPGLDTSAGGAAALGHGLPRSGRDAQLSRLGQQVLLVHSALDSTCLYVLALTSLEQCLSGMLWVATWHVCVQRALETRGVSENVCLQIKELQAQKARLEGLFEDSCSKRQDADGRNEQLRRQLDAEKAGRVKQVMPLRRQSCTLQVNCTCKACMSHLAAVDDRLSLAICGQSSRQSTGADALTRHL